MTIFGSFLIFGFIQKSPRFIPHIPLSSAAKRDTDQTPSTNVIQGANPVIVTPKIQFDRFQTL